MKRLTTLALILFLAFAGKGVAQAPSALSGKVVDIYGNPVTDFSFTIIPMDISNGYAEPRGSDLFIDILERGLQFLFPGQAKDTLEKMIQGQTGADGSFSVTDISPGFIHLQALPNIPAGVLDAAEMKKIRDTVRRGDSLPPEMMHLVNREPDKKILSIQFGNITAFETAENRHSIDEGLLFALPPGETFENVIITVKQRLRIRSRIVYADGTPFANANPRLRINMRDKGRDSTRSFSGKCATDADGYFTLYVDHPGIYTLSLDYNGLKAGTTPFELTEKKPAPDNLVLKFDGNPVTEDKMDNINDIDDIQKRIAQQKAREQKELVESVWVVNPANGHAYKRIPCGDWLDAQQEAIKQGAHLVSINDEAEQIWLLLIFGSGQPSWIGLNDVEKEGVWQWDSGEPVTYTHWTDREMFPGHPRSRSITDAEKDYVAMTSRYGGWQATVSRNRRVPVPPPPLSLMTRHAIIEKDGLVSKIPKPEKDDER